MHNLRFRSCLGIPLKWGELLYYCNCPYLPSGSYILPPIIRRTSQWILHMYQITLASILFSIERKLNHQKQWPFKIWLVKNGIERIWKEVWWQNLSYYYGICLEILRETMKMDRITVPGWDLNLHPSKYYKAGVLTIHHMLSIAAA